MSASWTREQRVIKVRVGSIERWKKLAIQLGLAVEHVEHVMLNLHVELTLERRAWLSAAELAKRLAPGAAAQMQALGLAENRHGQVVLLDIERTVTESLMRRNTGLRALPAKRARNLAAQLHLMHEQLRGRLSPYSTAETDERVLELLRARASDHEIVRRWHRALLSTAYPPVATFADLNRTWARWEQQ